jgi:hypothetical protein
MMGNILMGVAAGIFVGALAVEILKRTKPEVTKEVEKKAKNAVAALVAAFTEGGGDDETESKEPEQAPV